MAKASAPLFVLAGALVASLPLARPAHAFESGDHGGITVKVAQKMGYTDAAAEKLKNGNLQTDSKDWAVAEKHYGQTSIPSINAALWKQAKTSGDANLKGLYGTNFLHFDHESFVNGSKALNERMKLIIKAIDRKDREEALWLMGSAMHSTQDFFAHSNYVEKYSKADKSYKRQLEDVSSAKLPHSEIKRRENLYSLGAPDPKQKCARGAIPTSGPLTSGYWPDNFKIANKCHHADMNKDGDGGGFHNAAVGAAKLYCYDFLVKVEAEIRKAHPKDSAAWISFIKGKTDTVVAKGDAPSKPSSKPAAKPKGKKH